MPDKRKANSPCESLKIKLQNLKSKSSKNILDSSSEFDSFESTEETERQEMSTKEILSEVVTIRILKKNKEEFIGALDRPQAYEVWKQGLKLPATHVIGIGLVQNVGKPFMVDFHLKFEIELNKLPSKFEAKVGEHEYHCEVFMPKGIPPKLGEEVKLTFPKTRFRVKPDQINAWIGRFGILVKPTEYVDADDLPGMNTDDLTCVAKLRKHVPGTLPAYGRKLAVRYPGQPIQCNKCYQYNHLRAKCENATVDWINYVKAFVDDKEGAPIVPLELVGDWKKLF